MDNSKLTFGGKVNAFNASLNYTGILPKNIRIMNPFKENSCARSASIAFYDKFYDDNRSRLSIFGINPGRFGAGITGVPFTDPFRLKEVCNIHIPACPMAREPSSVFVYEIIKAYGGAEKFYADWYINSICPLGFVKQTGNRREKNYNYYDSAELKKAVEPFIIKTLAEQIDCGLNSQICFCFGKDKNYKFLSRINQQYNFFKLIIPLDHPRYIIQYKSPKMSEYANNYASIFIRASLEFRKEAIN